MTGEPDNEQTMDADILVMISLNRVEFFYNRSRTYILSSKM